MCRGSLEFFSEHDNLRREQSCSRTRACALLTLDDMVNLQGFWCFADSAPVACFDHQAAFKSAGIEGVFQTFSIIGKMCVHARAGACAKIKIFAPVAESSPINGLAVQKSGANLRLFPQPCAKPTLRRARGSPPSADSCRSWRPSMTTASGGLPTFAGGAGNAGSAPEAEIGRVRRRLTAVRYSSARSNIIDMSEEDRNM